MTYLLYTYLFIRGLHDRQEVLNARLEVLKYLKNQQNDIIDSSHPTEAGVLQSGCGVGCLPFMEKLQDCYGNLDVEAVGLKGTGWFTTDPCEITNKFGGQWKTIDFKAGDATIFTMRWQPADDPVDSRYIGDCKRDSTRFGLYSSDCKQTETVNTIENYKIKWGLN
ncbi:hypothetical protein LOTGIDRAFT_175404 [Lottia gigantea]|uniref:Uncharacterized protein n=1 Tax=Lottia gigantea TaxID=225164 RepID=V4ACQ9_LOTGI|nr:hypothetical protein LOTGIDRAFT_175404 [Lottia gigantea]ESO94632.1 hypothetical protein LOTGIDRAFT_175404 [Lottia gigantea]